MPVARLVHTNFRLRLLDLGWNSLGDEGCALIAAQLKANNALVQVVIIGPTVLIYRAWGTDCRGWGTNNRVWGTNNRIGY
jgi:hypothetical protein